MSVSGTYTLTSQARKNVFLKGSIALALVMFLQPSFAAEEKCDYGPPNLIKTIKTPFNLSTQSDDETKANPTDDLGSISLAGKPESSHKVTAPSVIQKMSIKGRLAGSKLYLPERMLIGQTCKFTVKAKPGMFVAIAMADRDKGAKPIAGHELRLGPDRKVVAISKVPETGVAEIYVETPIEGDLIGQYLFFEAALWSKEDLSDIDWAQTITAGTSDAPGNAVMIAQASEVKRGVRIVPDGAMPMILRSNSSSLSSGQP